MKNIQGFVTISDLISNDPEVVAPVGELSAWAKTYSLDRGLYRDPAVPGYHLTSFSSLDINTGDVFVLNPLTVSEVLRVVESSRNYVESHVAPYDPLDFVNNLLLSHSGALTDVKAGAFIAYGSFAMPEWISWRSSSDGDIEIKIWMADKAFCDQYENFHIEIIPPLDNLDTFFDEYNTQIQRLATVRPSHLSDKMQDTKRERPETVSRIHDYYYHNSINPNQKNYVSWGILIYGQAGDNIDSIKDALEDYILKNSSHTREEWEKIFPDIFKRTEFLVVPMWTKVSIGNITELARLYSPIVHGREVEGFIKANFPQYTEVHVETKLRNIPYPHKHLNLATLSGTGNTSEQQTLDQMFPDYLPVPSTSLDYNRMREVTRNWSAFMFDLVVEADKVTTYTSVPRTMRKVRRNGVLFVSALHNNINYLVAARSNQMFQ